MGQMPFSSPNCQCQGTDGSSKHRLINGKSASDLILFFIHHQTPEGMGVASFTLAIRCQVTGIIQSIFIWNTDSCTQIMLLYCYFCVESGVDDDDLQSCAVCNRRRLHAVLWCSVWCIVCSALWSAQVVCPTRWDSLWHWNIIDLPDIITSASAFVCRSLLEWRVKAWKWMWIKTKLWLMEKPQGGTEYWKMAMCVSVVEVLVENWYSVRTGCTRSVKGSMIKASKSFLCRGCIDQPACTARASVNVSDAECRWDADAAVET